MFGNTFRKHEWEHFWNPSWWKSRIFFYLLSSSASRTIQLNAMVLIGSEAQCPEAPCDSKCLMNKMGLLLKCCTELVLVHGHFFCDEMFKGSIASCNRSKIEMLLFHYCLVQKYTKDRHVKTELLKTHLFSHLLFHYIPNAQLLILACLVKNYVNLVQDLFKIKYKIMLLSIIS